MSLAASLLEHTVVLGCCLGQLSGRPNVWGKTGEEFEGALGWRLQRSCLRPFTWKLQGSCVQPPLMWKLCCSCVRQTGERSVGAALVSHHRQCLISAAAGGAAGGAAHRA